ncbi:restriction endonuclease [Salicibibacter halophilus]|uniref:Restriction endonuclease n=1 Tax=Salicibibacter halophilus TaxID=2502791 RepID=A0A514LG00_9BACI|nr:restriction endonuclease [Salicibibacter halophilus]QDI90768.1 restriction endonuclease [Salicibibacter halophilus]
MAIPDYQKLMLPLLKFFEDESEHHIREANEVLADDFQLTEEERAQLLPSGKQRIFNNRVNWANTYLKKAGLLESKRRGYSNITERGQDILKQNPQMITRNFLMQFESFTEFQQPSSSRQEAKNERNRSSTLGNDNQSQTPYELMDQTNQILKDDLAEQLLKTIKECSPEFFEGLVVQLLVKMGYGGSLKDAGQAVGKSGDGGIDGIIKEDQLGLDVIYLQAKRWEAVIGRPEIQKFAGALQGRRAKKGVFITTSSFTSEAKEYVNFIDNNIILLNGQELSHLMIDYNLGVSTKETIKIKEIDSDYFMED